MRLNKKSILSFFVVIRAHLRPIPKVEHPGLYVLYYPRVFYFCDKPHLHPSDDKYARPKNAHLQEVIPIVYLYQGFAALPNLCWSTMAFT